MVLFRTYNFYGKHANYMEALVTPITETLPPFFKRNIDVMFAASVVGFKFNKKADIDRSTEAIKKTINVEQIYPTMNQYKIEEGYNVVDLDYFSTSVQRLYSYDGTK